MKSKRATSLVMLAAACACRSKSACEELAETVPKDIVLSKDEMRCSELLDFEKKVGATYNMDFKTWLNTVPAQRVEIVFEAMLSITLRTDWTPTSFAMEPPEVPCGPGLSVDDTFWSTSVLREIYTKRPGRLYVALSMEIDSNVATIRAYQDFDCDKTLGVQELKGEFRQGYDPMNGGWTLISSALPEVDE